MIGRVLCLLGWHDVVQHTRDWGDGLRVWRFCRRPACNFIKTARVA